MQSRLPFDVPASAHAPRPVALSQSPRPSEEPPAPPTALPSALSSVPVTAPDAQANPLPATRVLADPTPVFNRHPRARRYVVRVKHDGSVSVTIPRWGTKREAQEFAARQQDWISRQRARLASQPPQAAPAISADEERELRKRAARELPARLLALAAEQGLTVSRISIRNQRWRWGSCSRNGHICLNWRLIAMPDWVRDYVLLHELMHLKRLDHSPRFWKLVARVCPTFQEARTWLRQHQALLDARN